MKFALINGNKTEATKGGKGTCPSCGSELIAKCGDFKVHHWAHKKIRNCDPWWENETEWHRAWKNNFPLEWQEVVLTDNNAGEKHIADIQSDHEVVIEFQHSHIDPQERLARENFYKKMVWVVDGNRLKRDYPRFLKGKDEIRRTNKPGFFIVDFPHECFSKTWLGSSVPVIFDFLGMEQSEGGTDLRNNLYCLLPENKGNTVLAVFSRESFIASALNGTLLSKPHNEPSQKAISPTIRIKRRTQQTHYYDPRKGKLVRRRRF